MVRFFSRSVLVELREMPSERALTRSSGIASAKNSPIGQQMRVHMYYVHERGGGRRRFALPFQIDSVLRELSPPSVY